MPSANKKISWFQNADLLPFSSFPAELRGAQSPPSLSPQASLWGCHNGQARTLLQFILSCLVKEMTPRRAVHVLFLNYPRFYNFNSLPFKWAEKWMWSLLILHVLHACNTTLSFGFTSLQGYHLEQGLDGMEQELCNQLYLCPSSTFVPSFQGMNDTKMC